MSPITRASFLGYTDLPREEVQVPQLGGSVWVRTLTAFERDAFEQAHAKTKGRDFRARLVVACACDEKGVDLFEVGDVASVSKLACSVVDPIVNAALRINKLSEAEDAATEKN